MAFELTPGKLGFKIGDVLVGLKSGTTDTPETIASTDSKLHTLKYLWNPSALAWEVATTGGVGVGQEVRATNEQLPVTPFGVSADAAGRQRVAQLTTLFDGKTLGQDDPYRWENVGTGVFTFQQNKCHMAVTAGQYCIRASPHYNPYFSGKSQICEWTFDGFQPEAGVIKRFGYFSSAAVAPYDSDKDGFWIESSGGTVRLVVSRFGVEVLNLPWENWDQYTRIASYDWSAFTVSAIDFLWLGGAVLRVFLMVNGRFELAHTFRYAGTAADCFFRSPKQPLRYEVRSIGGAGSLRAICAQVATEGSIVEEGDALTVSTTPSGISAGTVGVTYALKGIRKNAAFRDAHVDVVEFGGSSLRSGAPDAGRFLLLLAPTLTAALTYTPNSCIEEGSALAGQQVSSLGRVLAVAEVVGAGVSAVVPNNYLSSLLIGLNNAPQEVVLAYQPFTSSQTVRGYITLKEN